MSSFITCLFKILCICQKRQGMRDLKSIARRIVHKTGISRGRGVEGEEKKTWNKEKKKKKSKGNSRRMFCITDHSNGSKGIYLHSANVYIHKRTMLSEPFIEKKARKKERYEIRDTLRSRAKRMHLILEKPKPYSPSQEISSAKVLSRPRNFEPKSTTRQKR